MCKLYARVATLADIFGGGPDDCNLLLHYFREVKLVVAVVVPNK